MAEMAEVVSRVGLNVLVEKKILDKVGSAQMATAKEDNLLCRAVATRVYPRSKNE